MVSRTSTWEKMNDFELTEWNFCALKPGASTSHLRVYVKTLSQLHML
jgi:hypothetical protein